jgi:hypothetical protein
MSDVQNIGELLIALGLTIKIVYDYATSAGRASRSDVTALRKENNDNWIAMEAMRGRIAILEGQIAAGEETNKALRTAAEAAAATAAAAATVAAEAATAARSADANAATTAAQVAAENARLDREGLLARMAAQDVQIVSLRRHVALLTEQVHAITDGKVEPAAAPIVEGEPT